MIVDIEGKKCIKCGYERKASETAPEYECPSCGVIYSKVEALSETINCPICHEEIKKGAIKCKHCKSTLKGNNVKHNNKSSVLYIILGVILVPVLIMLATSDRYNNFVSTKLTNSSSSFAPTWTESLMGSQNNAVRAAKNYLSFSGFSRAGLVHQLSSDAGDGYNVTDATIAVDSLKINWNKQAVRSAKHYLSFSGFSCKDLINQLSSSAGDKYTDSQANYGARQTSACQ